MNIIRTLLVAGLVLGISSLVSAQEPEREKPSEPEAPKAAPAPRQEQPREAKPEKQENEKAPKDEAKPTHEEKGGKKQAAHGGPAGNSGKGNHIPDSRFKANFGKQHAFVVNRVITQRTVVVGQTQFVYGGYTFLFADPWPAEWAYTDDCYIDYVNDEYVLVDVVHPGMFVELVIVS